jgi:nucleoside-diphosphate-sugar epimerase
VSSGASPSEARAGREVVAVTGADGFVGRALCSLLEAHGVSVRRLQRASGGDKRAFAVGDIGPDTDWSAALQGIHDVVHLAARVHVMRDTTGDPLAEYRRVNVEGTRTLARAAVTAGVARLVFLSSIKVNGESTRLPFTEDDAPAPQDSYGVSKWEAEQALTQVARGSAMQWVILRPPLLYGPGVAANFLRLMHAVARGLPLPLATIDNRRSLLYLGNLVDAIRVCLSEPGAGDRLFLLSDGDDVSSAQLVRRLAAALQVRARLLRVPVAWLRMAGSIIGKSAAVERLVGSLQVDSSRFRAALGWSPPFSLEQGLAETARWYRDLKAATLE